MKRVLRHTLIALALLLLVSAPVLANGPYFGLFGGGLLLDESRLDDDTGNYTLKHEPGLAAGVALGYELGPTPQLDNGRLEIEAAYRSTALDTADFATGKVAANGDIIIESLMFNTIGEYHELPDYIPYVALGVGAARITFDNTTVAGSPLIDDEDTVFAYQVRIGVAYELLSHLTLDLGYRYFGLSDSTFTDALDREVEGEYSSHSLELGLRLPF